MENVNPDVVVIVIGIVAAVGIVAIAYLRASNNTKWLAIAELVAPVLPAMLGKADTALAVYGSQLKPVNDAVGAISTLIDEDTDWVTMALPRPLVDALREALGIADDLTDGEVEPVQEVNIGGAAK